jgi:hypothetical protein
MSSSLARGAATNINRHMPTILTALSVAGLAATAFMFHQAGVKSGKHLIDRNLRNTDVTGQYRYEDREYPAAERIQDNWPNYLIPTSIGIATVVCLVSTNVLNTKRQATLMAAYALGERTWSKYKDKVAELMGEEAESTVRSEVIKDMATSTSTGTIIHGDGDTVYLDSYTGQLFRSDEATILKAQEQTCEKAEEDGFVKLNYFFDRVGANMSDLGENVGWSDGFLPDITFTEVFFEDGTRGLGIDYGRVPFWGYHEV